MNKVKAPETKNVLITPPNFGRVTLTIGGAGVPLVIHRFSQKTLQEMEDKMVAGKVASSRKNRTPKDIQATFEEARYRGPGGWDGIQASAFRKAMIDACRLTSLKMVLAKLSVFVEADGYDVKEPQIPLVRIYGEPTLQKDLGRVQTGQPYVIIRPAFHDWKANVRIKWDQDQFSLTDVTNLMMRVGAQIGVGEGRPNSKVSAGMGWGLFDILDEEATDKPKKKKVAVVEAAA